MRFQILLGAAVGLGTALSAWSGNQEDHLVSVFPDGVTLLVLCALLNLAVRAVLRRRNFPGRATSFRAGLTTSAAAGIVFGSVVVWLALLRFSAPSVSLLAFGFFVAFASSVWLWVDDDSLLVAWPESMTVHDRMPIMFSRVRS